MWLYQPQLIINKYEKKKKEKEKEKEKEKGEERA